MMNKIRTKFLSLILLISLSSCSTSILRKSLIRRQTDQQYCHAIDGFDCKCSYYRVTCTNDRDLSSPINIINNEKGKYQSVELVITAQREIHVNDRTFESVKELYKSDVDNLEFRVKFEKFTALQLSSPEMFNRVFPDNLLSTVRKHIALEIYNPEVPPQDNKNLFQNLNVDSLELYALYPFHGTFQELFNGANIKYLRLSGGDIRSDLSQPFTGNIARLELAKQASSLSAQNFPVYPAHELIINAFYITDFHSEHPPNYSNLGELRVHSPDRIPANAFRQFPNIHTLSISTEQDIDPQALNGLHHLEKLTIKDAKPSVDLVNSVPQVKEFEASVEKLDERTQCQLLEKLSSGQLALQAIPNGRECTCVSAYLDNASGRAPCDAQYCDQSTCPAIKNNYDVNTRTFKAPPPILRADGTDAFRQRETKVYSTSYQVPHQDQEKLQNSIPTQRTSEQDQRDDQSSRTDSNNNQPSDSSDNRPSSNDNRYETNHFDHNDQQNQDREDSSKSETQSDDQYDGQSNFDWNKKNDDHGKSQDEHSNHNQDQQSNNDRDNDIWNKPDTHKTTELVDDVWNIKPTRTSKQGFDVLTTSPSSIDDDGSVGGVGGKQPDEQDGNRDNGEQTTSVDGGDDNRRGDNNDNQSDGDNNDNQSDGDNNDNQSDGDKNASNTGSDSSVDGDGASSSGSDSATPAKKGMSWLPIIIIIASIVGLLLIGLLYLLIHKRCSNRNYNETPKDEPTPIRS